MVVVVVWQYFTEHLHWEPGPVPRILVSVFHFITQHNELSTFLSPSYRHRTWNWQWARNLSKPHGWLQSPWRDLWNIVFQAVKESWHFTRRRFYLLAIVQQNIISSEKNNKADKENQQLRRVLNNIRNYDNEGNFTFIKFPPYRLATTQQEERKVLSGFMMSHDTPSDSVFRNIVDWTLHLLVMMVVRWLLNWWVQTKAPCAVILDSINTAAIEATSTETTGSRHGWVGH